jgi:hypothetical protein
MHDVCKSSLLSLISMLAQSYCCTTAPQQCMPTPLILSTHTATVCNTTLCKQDAANGVLDVKPLLHAWQGSAAHGRGRATPHFKSYCSYSSSNSYNSSNSSNNYSNMSRNSNHNGSNNSSNNSSSDNSNNSNNSSNNSNDTQDDVQIDWFLLTSANLGPSAWGTVLPNNRSFNEVF